MRIGDNISFDWQHKQKQEQDCQELDHYDTVAFLRMLIEVSLSPFQHPARQKTPEDEKDDWGAATVFRETHVLLLTIFYSSELEAVI